MSTVNHQFRLASRPVGLPDRSVWKYTEEPLPEPKDGEVVVKVLYISLDPAMRGWMSEAKSYVPPVGIGDVMRALGAGKVITSKFPGLAVGDYVSGFFGVQEYATVPGKALSKIDAPAEHQCQQGIFRQVPAFAEQMMQFICSLVGNVRKQPMNKGNEKPGSTFGRMAVGGS